MALLVVPTEPKPAGASDDGLCATREKPCASVRERAARLREIKQHIDETESIRAVETIDQWSSEVGHPE